MLESLLSVRWDEKEWSAKEWSAKEELPALRRAAARRGAMLSETVVVGLASGSRSSVARGDEDATGFGGGRKWL